MTPEWMRDAACKGKTDVMFPESKEWKLTGNRHPAVKVCATCPVVAECRDYALRNMEMYGTWGGLTENHRRRLMSGMVVQVQCPHCRGWFERAMTGRAVYCSPVCGREANKARMRERERARKAAS